MSERVASRLSFSGVLLLLTGLLTAFAAPRAQCQRAGSEAAPAAQAIPDSPQKLQPIAPNADPSFAVATIKPSKPDEPLKSPLSIGYRTVLPMTSVLSLMSFVYDVREKQILGGPVWMTKDKFDLKFHREQREMSAYFLTSAKDGPKLGKSNDPSALPKFSIQGLSVLKAQNVTMTDFTNMMQSTILDRPAVDQTGMRGKYDFVLKWTPDESQFTEQGIRVPPPGRAADAPSLFTAIQEQLGLKLKAGKALVPVFMVDHVERPGAN